MTLNGIHLLMLIASGTQNQYISLKSLCRMHKKLKWNVKRIVMNYSFKFLCTMKKKKELFFFTVSFFGWTAILHSYKAHFFSYCGCSFADDIIQFFDRKQAEQENVNTCLRASRIHTKF